MRPRFPEGWLTSGVDPSTLSERTVANANKWDRQDWNRLLGELAAVHVATEQMAEFGDTGRPLMEDAWYALFKVVPSLSTSEDVKPEFLVNLQVMGEFMTLNEYMDLHTYTAGDDVAAGMALATLEPELEQLLDRQRKRQEEAEQLQQLMQQLADAQAEKRSIDELIEAWAAQRDEQADEGDSAGEPGDDEESDGEPDEQGEMLQARAQMTEDAIEQLTEAIEAAGQALSDAMGSDMPGIRQALAEAIGEAADQARFIAQASEAWGVERGQLQRMPADERLALAKKLNTPRLKEIAELFGPLKQLMFTEQARKVKHAQTEVIDIEKGNDLARVLPTEMVRLCDPDLEDGFLRDFVTEELFQYRLEGEEKVGKGAIIMPEDGSASMRGEPELRSKAFMLCMLHLARQQGRAFYLIHFGSRGEIYPIAFEKPEDFTTERILAAAELFCNGGTDFETPLNHAVEKLQAEYQAKGRVEGDIVFVTDGICGVTPRWLEWFKEEQARLKFQVWGVGMSHYHSEEMTKAMEPLRTISDGRVAVWEDLTGGGDVREVFREI